MLLTATGLVALVHPRQTFRGLADITWKAGNRGSIRPTSRIWKARTMATAPVIRAQIPAKISSAWREAGGVYMTGDWFGEATAVPGSTGPPTASA